MSAILILYVNNNLVSVDEGGARGLPTGGPSGGGVHMSIYDLLLTGGIHQV